MEDLTFNVAQLLKEPYGATRIGDVSVPFSMLLPDLQLAELDPLEAAPVIEGEVQLMHSTEGVLVQGTLSVEISLPCSRCLDPVSVPLDIDVEENFCPTIDIITGQSIVPEEEDEALWIDEHHILDLTEVLRQDTLVAIPLVVHCREECLGLCPTCGKNLNEGSCECRPEPDPRWTSLLGLLDKP